eukprot:COSAG02_NODE_34049_length_490_cov_1.023018_1_plen_47_part_10
MVAAGCVCGAGWGIAHRRAAAMRSTMVRVSSGDMPDSINVVIGPGKQ